MLPVNTAIFQFSYGYAFFLNPRFEAGLAIGAHIVGSKVGMGIATSSEAVPAKKLILILLLPCLILVSGVDMPLVNNGR